MKSSLHEKKLRDSSTEEHLFAGFHEFGHTCPGRYQRLPAAIRW
jgi:hypothetical protein